MANLNGAEVVARPRKSAYAEQFRLAFGADIFSKPGAAFDAAQQAQQAYQLEDNGSVRLFTDFTYAAIGVPRNMDIPANRNPRYADLGICARADHRKPDDAQYCGMFKTPTLRNVATGSVFFHNGALKSLRDVANHVDVMTSGPTTNAA